MPRKLAAWLAAQQWAPQWAVRPVAQLSARLGDGSRRRRVFISSHLPVLSSGSRAWSYTRGSPSSQTAHWCSQPPPRAHTAWHACIQHGMRACVQCHGCTIPPHDLHSLSLSRQVCAVHTERSERAGPCFVTAWSTVEMPSSTSDAITFQLAAHCAGDIRISVFELDALERARR